MGERLVRKRNGMVEPFDEERIRKAIAKAFQAVTGGSDGQAKKITKQALSNYKKDGLYDIEHIQDTVEKTLVDNKLYRIAKAYILYRQQHTDLRDLGFVLTSNQAIEDYLGLTDWRVKENSNMAYSIQGLNNFISSTVTANFWLNRIYPEEIRNLHENGDFHLHDLGQLSVYCCGWDLPALLIKGFGGVGGKVQSTPPKHFRTALGHIVNFFYTMQGECAGAVAFSNLDTYLAPYIAKDKLSYKEVKQAVQEFIFNLNVPTRVGFQTPFTNVTLDLSCPENLKSMPAIIGGIDQKEKLGAFQKEMDLFNRAFAEVMCEGDASGRVFTFPIPTYNITKDFDWSDDNLNPIWEMTAKYGIPYFSNFVNSDLSPDDARSMCCRLRLDNRELRKRGGGLFGANPMTGSIGVVTLNLPRLGFLAKSKKELFGRLENLMDYAKESLVIKRKVLEEYTQHDLYPYSKYYLGELFEQNKRYWGNHFSTIGLVGMNECVENLIGKDISTQEGNALAQELLSFMRARIADYQEETGELFNLEATPAEGTSYRLARLDKQLHPGLRAANEKAWKKNTKKVAPFYTNSSHLPVNHTQDVFEALELQDALQTKYTGGTVLHAFVGEHQPDAQAVKAFVKKVCENFELPYFTLSPTFSICPAHGYLKGEHPYCPECKQSCEVYSRIVGYLRPVQNWNKGKQEEFSHRKTYKIKQTIKAGT